MGEGQVTTPINHLNQGEVMTARIEKTVFISYRRTNLPWALAIYQELTHHGYDVFFDYLSIPSGDFESIIVENIKARAHFVVILTPSALERCNEPGDWLRREIETAMDEKRNIIPLMLESFDFGSPATVTALSGKLERLKKYNGLRLHSEYFFEGMNRFREQYLNVSLDAVVHPISESTKPITKEHKTAASEANAVEIKQLTAQEWFERGHTFQDVDNTNEAIRCYTEAIILNPDFSYALNNRGVLYESQGELERAITDYTEVIRINPRQIVAAYSNRGNARHKMGDLDNALKDLTEAIRLDPYLPTPYFNRATLKRDMGNRDEAIEDFSTAIRLDASDSAYYANRGVEYMMNGELDKAIKDFTDSIKLDNSVASIFLLRSHAYSQNNEIQNAIADTNEALRIQPDDAIAYKARGNLFAYEGNHYEALLDFQKACALEPNNGSARVSLAKALRFLNSLDEAQEEARIARELIQNEYEYEYELACLEVVFENTSRALELLKIALEKNQVAKEWVRQDPDFESVRNNPRFKDLVGE